MEKEGISPSALADQIGISRPLMSHVMSGRNKPSLQLVLKLLERFPHYSADWLLLGKSDLPQPTTQSDAEQKPNVPDVTETSATAPIEAPVQNDVSMHGSKSTSSSDSEQVIIFYNDNTYSVYKPR